MESDNHAAVPVPDASSPWSVRSPFGPDGLLIHISCAGFGGAVCRDVHEAHTIVLAEHFPREPTHLGSRDALIAFSLLVDEGGVAKIGREHRELVGPVTCRLQRAHERSLE